jgi:hypothetical protein
VTGPVIFESRPIWGDDRLRPRVVFNASCVAVVVPGGASAYVAIGSATVLSMSSDLVNESLVWRASAKEFFHSLLGIGKEMMKVGLGGAIKKICFLL